MPESASIPIWTAVIAALSALFGALGGQFLAGRNSLKEKRLDLLFRSKLEAYERVLDLAGKFAMSPNDQDKYRDFLSAYERAFVVASPEVAAALTDSDGLNMNAQRVRGALQQRDRDALIVGSWFQCMQRLRTAMRADVQA